MGETTWAMGVASTSMGMSTAARANAAVSMGIETDASGVASLASGFVTAAEGDYSVAMGSWATAAENGSFVFGDASTQAWVTAPAANSFTARAAGGYYLYSNAALTSGVTLASGGGSWASVSDRDLKENFREEDGEQVLASIASMPIRSWNYKAQDPSIRHIGPVAQDFYSAFGFGIDDKRINTVDIDGINMLGIQALEGRTRDLLAENAELRNRINELEAALLWLEALVLGKER
jgi:hypothetical protein